MTNYTFIKSGVNFSGTRIILWSKGNYQYQIEAGTGEKKNSVEFTAEYYDAIEIFDKLNSEAEV
jgi:hypothetical protein